MKFRQYLIQIIATVAMGIIMLNTVGCADNPTRKYSPENYSYIDEQLGVYHSMEK